VGAAPAQAQAPTGAAALQQAVHGIGTSVRVLMIGAHPDDEDTPLIAYLARGRQVETAYLSLTRGDGGQNRIGNELGESLGAIRTEELLAARRVDGGKQYFARAYDFGFSKDSAETLTQWDREELLGDVVRVIRAMRPHVILSVFSGTARDGHGHHQVAGLLTRDAFALAGDTLRFARRTHGEPWTPAKLYRSTRFDAAATTLTLDVGAYDPVLGRTYAELAGMSRTQHKSQAFGSPEPRGAQRSGVARVATRVNADVAATDERSLFDGLDSTWARHRAVASTPALRVAVDSVPLLAQVARATLDLRAPAGSVPVLARLNTVIGAALDDVRCRWPSATAPCTEAESDLASSLVVAQERAAAALLAAAGLRIEALVDRPFLAFGDTATVTLQLDNRGPWPVTLRTFGVTGAQRDVRGLPLAIAADSSARVTQRILGLMPQGAWWLMVPRNGALFDAFTTRADGLRNSFSAPPAPVVRAVAVTEDRRHASAAEVTLEIAGHRVTVPVAPLQFRRVDAVQGELRTPLTPVPAVSLRFDRQLELARADVAIDRSIRLEIRSYSDRPRTVRLSVDLPPGVTADALPDTMTLAAGAVREVAIRLRGRLPEGRFPLTARAVERVVDDAGGRGNGTFTYASGWTTIDYPHIRPVHVFRSAGLFVQGVRTALPTTTKPIAYVPGVSDDGIPVLRMLGLRVQEIAPERLAGADLAPYDVLVIGPRAYQAAPRLVEATRTIEAFARRGGTVLLQYGQQELATPGLLPYPISMTPQLRVTDETAAVTLLDPRARALTVPNRLGDADWADWVQERALYIPSTVDAAWTPLLRMADPGEAPADHSLLVARVGAGTYVYTSLALFRQLPAGVPGAIRLFVNLLSAGGR
jgi:LmbE family N-acetylglucosaminyl deacetylase